MNSAPHINDTQQPNKLGWLDLGIAAIAALVFYAIGIAAMLQVPADATSITGLAAYTVSGLAPILAVTALVMIRRHGLQAVGLKKVPAKWMAIGFGLGLVVVALNLVSVMILDAMSEGELESVQGGYQSAATAGFLSLLAALALGAFLTPFGEELLFRGVLANALSKYGAWVAVLVSSTIFALVHGINYTLPVAFMVGVFGAILLRRTGSIWPGVIVHVVNNTASVLLPAAFAFFS